MSLEAELRRALQRKDPPNGFDDRVLSRITAGETVRLSQPQSNWARMSLPFAASVILAFGTTMYVQHRQQQHEEERRTRVEQSAREVVLALQIASDTISAAQAKVEEITRYEPTNSH